MKHKKVTELESGEVFWFKDQNTEELVPWIFLGVQETYPDGKPKTWWAEAAGPYGQRHFYTVLVFRVLQDLTAPILKPLLMDKIVKSWESYIKPRKKYLTLEKWDFVIS